MYRADEAARTAQVQTWKNSGQRDAELQNHRTAVTLQITEKEKQGLAQHLKTTKQDTKHPL